MPDVAPTPNLDIRRAEDRFVTRIGWLDSRHSFSFAGHWDPDNTHHGVLMVNNDDTVAPGAGFDPHAHRDMEIVTWVLEGSLVHRDSEGNAGVIRPGLAQRMSAGSGIVHSERNDAGVDQGGQAPGIPVRFIQMWVVPDQRGIAPGYQQADIGDELDRGGLVPVASGLDRHRADAAVRIHNRHAGLHAARLAPGASVTVPEAPYVHLFVARGMIDLEGAGVLNEGDAARLSAAGQRRVEAIEPAEMLVWEMYATIA